MGFDKFGAVCRLILGILLAVYQECLGCPIYIYIYITRGLSVASAEVQVQPLAQAHDEHFGRSAEGPICTVLTLSVTDCGAIKLRLGVKVDMVPYS